MTMAESGEGSRSDTTRGEEVRREGPDQQGRDQEDARRKERQRAWLRYRVGIFLPSCLGLGALLVWAIYGLPPFGDYHGSYGRILNAVTAVERRAANVVSAVNYDYRAVDTLGEEFILFAAVTGVSLLLRLTRKERAERVPEPREIDEALRYAGAPIVATTVLFGIYVVTHGQLTPGGGFQGGAIVATGVLLLYLVAGYDRFRRVTPRDGAEALEALGTGGYAIVGILGLILGEVFLQNFLPLGEFRKLLSGGTIPLISLLVGCAVAGGFTLLYREFLEVAVETTQEEHEEGEES
jgi:multicomponent Na+:H+ antiporter subunit B